MSKPHKRIAAALVLLMLVSGCSSTAWMRPRECALIGLAGGVVAGVGYAATEDDSQFEDWALGIGVGAAGGALVGWAFCSIVDTSPHAAIESDVKVADHRLEDAERYGLAALPKTPTPLP